MLRLGARSGLQHAGRERPTLSWPTAEPLGVAPGGRDTDLQRRRGSRGVHVKSGSNGGGGTITGWEALATHYTKVQQHLGNRLLWRSVPAILTWSWCKVTLREELMGRTRSSSRFPPGTDNPRQSQSISQPCKPTRCCPHSSPPVLPSYPHSHPTSPPPAGSLLFHG